MNLNLDELKTEVLEYMESESLVVFHGYSRLAETDSFVAWDTDRLPNYRSFLGAAKKAGVKMIVYHFREFSATHLEDAEEQIEEAELTADDRRSIERRLRDLRSYEGFTCALELSFDYQGRIYLFNLRADWYDDYLDLVEELDSSLGEDEEDDDESMGGYYSRN
ncbi:MAG TPA: hypothetical protein VHA11_06090 [Bryobacteraceae bacterium]|nr:hypothetical protein [Bryobacteraceae bacterium]